MKPTSKNSKSGERNSGPQLNQTASTSHRNTPGSSNKNQFTDNKRFDSKTRSNGSPRKYEKSKDPRKDPFSINTVEKRFVLDDEDENLDYEYEYTYESTHNNANKNIQNNSRNKNSPKNANSPRSQLSPRKKKIAQKIMKLEAELRDLQSSVISGMTNENSESISDVAQKINAKKKKINELERLAELEKRESKEENENQELRRRIEILEKNQEVILSPKPKPNLGFMSPNDAIISIKAQPFNQIDEGSSLIERRNQDPLNVDIPNKQSNHKSPKKKDNKQFQDRAISISSEKKLNESSFCQMNPIDAKNFADNHIQDILSSDTKKFSSQPKSKTKNLSSHHEPDQQHPGHKSNSSTKKVNDSSRHRQKSPKTIKDRKSHHEDQEPENYSSNRSNHSSKNNNKSQKAQPEKTNIVTRSAEIKLSDDDHDNEDLYVDVTIVEVKKIPEASVYCVIYTEAFKESASKTKVANRGPDSNIINESFHFSFDQSIPKSDVLVVIVKKEDLLKGDKIIGSVKIDLSAVIRSMAKKKVKKLDKIFPILADSKIQTEGRLHLILRSDCTKVPSKSRMNDRKQENENKIKKTRKVPSVSDNNNSSKNELDQQIEPAIQQNQKSSEYHSDNTSFEDQQPTQNLIAPQKEIRVEKNSSNNSVLSQNSNSSQNAKQKQKQIINSAKSPKSPKYNWNNGSLINKSNKKKPIFEILSENDEEDQGEPEQDAYDENAPALNPSSFPIPKIKYSPSIAAGIEERNEINNQLALSLSDILEKTASPVLTREVNLPFENESFEEEEEINSEESLIEISEGSSIEPVSEDEEQIINQLDKKFGKEPPRLSSAEPSELDYNFNKSEDTVTFNLGDLAKYYEPRFIDTVPKQRSNERKQKQKLAESRKAIERTFDIFDEIEEEDADDINEKFDDNFNAMKKKQRITKVSSNDNLLDSDENEEQFGILPIDEDDESEGNDNQKLEDEDDEKDSGSNDNSNDDHQNTQKLEEEEENSEDKININGKNKDIFLSDHSSKNDVSEPIDPLNLDYFISDQDKKQKDNNSKKDNNSENEIDNELEKFEKVSSFSSNQIVFKTKEDNVKSNENSISLSISSFSNSSSLLDNSFKSSLDQAKFIESVKKINGANNSENEFDFNDDSS